MIVIIGGVQAEVRIDMSMPKAPDPKAESQNPISPWEQEAYGAGGRFGNLQMMPSGDPTKDRISVHFSGCGYNVAKRLAGKGRSVAFISVVGDDPLGLAAAAGCCRDGSQRTDPPEPDFDPGRGQEFPRGYGVLEGG